MRQDWIWKLAVTLVGMIFMVGALWLILKLPPPPITHPNDETQTVVARVIRVIPNNSASGITGQSIPAQILEIEILNGAATGKRVIVEQDTQMMMPSDQIYYAGDQVLAMVVQRADDATDLWTVTDFVRTGPLAILILVFLVAVVLVSGWKGVRALIGLGVSFIVLFGFILPQILAGQDPIIVSVLGSCLLLTFTLYLTQGWSLKTHTALAGVIASLILTGILAAFATSFTRLSGLGSEESMFLQIANTPLNARGLVLAGMIVGTLGVLDDVIVGQASTVTELAQLNPSLTWRELYTRAMNVGHDHIAATINTLVLAYVGASMSLLLLFQIYPEPWQYTINRELLAEEIVRTLVGTLGLIAAVPITTWIASLLHTWVGQNSTSAQP